MTGGMRQDAVLVISPLGRIVEVDEASCALLGYDSAELVGMHGSELIVAKDRPAVAASLDRMKRGDISRREGALRHRDGKLVRVEVESTRLADGGLALRLRPLAD